MKSLILTIFSFMLCMTLSTTSFAVNSAPTDLSIHTMTYDQLVNMSAKEYKQITGKKLKFKQAVVLKAAQYKLKKATGKSGAPKSQVIALVLAIIAGALGIHRFYLGYTGIGIAQLLTAGGCGIWALIDIIRIAMGTLEPADGSNYDPKL